MTPILEALENLQGVGILHLLGAYIGGEFQIPLGWPQLACNLVNILLT